MWAKLIFFPTAAKVPVSFWGSGGWGCVRSTLRLRPQPFAIVRSRPQPFARGRHGRAYGESCKVVAFGGFKCRVASFRVAGHGTLWHSSMFHNALKVVLCGRRNTFASLSEDEFHFSWQAQHFGDLIVILRGRRSTLEESCCAFFANCIARAASSGDNVQIPWQTWHFVRCAAHWRKPRTKHRFWGSNFWGS